MCSLDYLSFLISILNFLSLTLYFAIRQLVTEIVLMNIPVLTLAKGAICCQSDEGDSN